MTVVKNTIDEGVAELGRMSREPDDTIEVSVVFCRECGSRMVDSGYGTDSKVSRPCWKCSGCGKKYEVPGLSIGKIDRKQLEEALADRCPWPKTGRKESHTSVGAELLDLVRGPAFNRKPPSRREPKP
jgi:DNA-directed RNA polymerase subunit RPC12/RpoP